MAIRFLFFVNDAVDTVKVVGATASSCNLSNRNLCDISQRGGHARGGGGMMRVEETSTTCGLLEHGGREFEIMSDSLGRVLECSEAVGENWLRG